MLSWFRRKNTEVISKVDLEIALNTKEQCPCGSRLFYRGPAGGMALNVKCAECGVKYWYAPPFTPCTIDNPDAVYNRKHPLRLSEM